MCTYVYWLNLEPPRVDVDRLSCAEPYNTNPLMYTTKQPLQQNLVNRT